VQDRDADFAVGVDWAGGVSEGGLGRGVGKRRENGGRNTVWVEDGRFEAHLWRKQWVLDGEVEARAEKASCELLVSRRLMPWGEGVRALPP
jgi:hypothetical protein